MQPKISEQNQKKIESDSGSKTMIGSTYNTVSKMYNTTTDTIGKVLVSGPVNLVIDKAVEYKVVEIKDPEGLKKNVDEFGKKAGKVVFWSGAGIVANNSLNASNSSSSGQPVNTAGDYSIK